MNNANPIFEKNYARYLSQLDDVDFAQCASMLDITVDEANKSAEIPFFNLKYRVSSSGVTDEHGNRPDYGICVVLLKHLLMCPQQVPTQNAWVTYRDFKDAGQAQDNGLSAYASQAVSKAYAGGLGRLQAAVEALGGKPPETEYPYDVSAVIRALPRLPVLLLFNDRDEQFPAQTSILYEQRASVFLDAECRIMVDWYLLKHLKEVKPENWN